MWVKSIRFYNYRNLGETILNLESGLNILVGHNGQGKTNFIEGLCLTLSGETLRFSETENLSKFGTNESLVSLVLGGDVSTDLALKIQNGRKNHLLNGKKINAQKLSSTFPVVLFSPESLVSIKEGSSERRDLIDQFLVSCHGLNYHQIFTDFGRILRSKNKVLKDHLDNSITREQAVNLLDSYESTYLNLAASVTFHRIQGIIHILGDLQNIASQIYASPVEISVEYLISDKNAMHYSYEQVYEALSNRLSELKSAEMAVGHSLVGPQKHDIKFLLNNRDSRTFCSQGQQRALILSFKLAQLMYHKRVYGIVPVLFLDDVLSELDWQTRTNFVNLLNVTEGQVFITTTDQYLCRDLRGASQRYISVSDGKFAFL